jgi:hypothetical protein
MQTDEQTAHPTTTDHQPDPAEVDQRLKQVQRLYTKCYAELLEAAHENPNTNIFDVDSLLKGLANNLHEYPGRVEGLKAESEFCKWGMAVLGKPRDFLALWRQSERRIYSRIRAVLVPCADLGCDADTINEVAGITAVWGLENLEDLLKPKQKATPCTRLCDMAYCFARGEKTRRLRSRKRFVDGDVADRIGVDERGNRFIEPAHYAREEAMAA